MRYKTKLPLGELTRPEDRVVCVRNLRYNATEEDIRTVFKGYGVIDCKIKSDERTSKYPTAFVLLEKTKDVNRALYELNGSTLHDRHIKICPATYGFEVDKSGLLKVTGPPSAQRTADLVQRGEPSASTPHISPTGLRRGESDTQKCSLLMYNVHLRADEAAIKEFFAEYDVIAFKRCLDRKTGKPIPIAFVLLGSFKQREKARKRLSGQNLMGERLKLYISGQHAYFDMTDSVPLDGGSKAIATRSKSALPNSPSSLSAAEPVDKNTTLSKHAKQDERATTLSNDKPVSYHDTERMTDGRWDPFTTSKEWKDARFFTSQCTVDSEGNPLIQSSKPWNMALDDSYDKAYNMLTLDEWNTWLSRDTLKNWQRPLSIDSTP